MTIVPDYPIGRVLKNAGNLNISIYVTGNLALVGEGSIGLNVKPAISWVAAIATDAADATDTSCSAYTCRPCATTPSSTTATAADTTGTPLSTVSTISTYI
jgi:hypothetical protein